MPSETLTQLTKKTSSGLERLRAGDSSAIDTIQVSLVQITTTVEAMTDAPKPWLDQTRDSTTAALLLSTYDLGHQPFGLASPRQIEGLSLASASTGTLWPRSTRHS